MDRERISEIARNIKDKAHYAAYVAGGFTGGYATSEGILTGNKTETAVGVTAGAITTIKIASKFIHREITKRAASPNSSS